MLLLGSLALASDLAAMVGAMPDCPSQLAAMRALSTQRAGDERTRLEIGVAVMEQLEEDHRFTSGACGRCAVASVSDDAALRAGAAAAANRGLACPSLTARPDQAAAITRYRSESLHLVDTHLHLAASSTMVMVGAPNLMVPIVLTTPAVDAPTWKVVTGDGETLRPMDAAVRLQDEDTIHTLRRRRARGIGGGIGGVLLGTAAFAWSLDSFVNDDVGTGAVMLLAASGLYTAAIGVPATAAAKNRSITQTWDRLALEEQIDTTNAGLRRQLGLEASDVVPIDEIVELWDPEE